jgi:dTMP kinase
MAFPSSATSKRGLLIVIEGLDRSGKSSQCQRLFDFLRLQGQRVRYTKFPGLLANAPVIAQLVTFHRSDNTDRTDDQ